MPKAPNYDREQEAIRTLLKRWAKASRSPADGKPEKLIYPLEHAYTPAEFGLGSLKGADAGIAEVVVAATRHSGCDVHFALISIEESGSAEYTGDDYRSRHGRYRDDDEHADEFEVVEVTDRRAVASAWRCPDGESSPLTEMPLMEGEFSPPVSFEELEPDEEHFHEATGNEGASFERAYSRAALILWPSDRLLAVINQAGRAVTLPFLADLADRWTANGAVRTRRYGIRRGFWPNTWFPAGAWIAGIRTGTKSPPTLADSWTCCCGWGTRPGRGVRHRARRPPSLDHGRLRRRRYRPGSLPPERAAPLARSLIEDAAESALGPCANLLVRLSEPDPALVIGAARALVAALPGDPARGSAARTWRRDPRRGARFHRRSAHRARPHRAQRSLRPRPGLFSNTPATYDFDTVVVPAVCTLLRVPETAALATL